MIRNATENIFFYPVTPGLAIEGDFFRFYEEIWVGARGEGNSRAEIELTEGCGAMGDGDEVATPPLHAAWAGIWNMAAGY